MKLEWKKTELNKMSWDNAKKLEKDGWRLPTRAELVDAFDNKVEGFKLEFYWSSNTYEQSTNNSWNVDFNYGNVYGSTKASNYYVRLCREVE
jgi:hypothetical protein